ncbi:phosphatidylcholine and lysophosphatidylcholine phospholipase, partial [Trapelia coarctata]|nr:phosphatidylcholine and lysophosphatidylcholine phospholipase [Trapelia coarctata]
MAPTAHRRYAEIMHDVEELINDHITHQRDGTWGRSKLKLLVPGVGIFFTPLLLENAFRFQDEQRRISSRRFVPPSFNDIRLILNTAQVMGVLAQHGSFDLITFDGDVTLYNDGECLTADNPVITRILRLLSQGTKVAIVTAAGYSEPERYYGRLSGLLEAMSSAIERKELYEPTLVVVGGESSYLFSFDVSSEHLLRHIPRSDWMLDEMRAWTEADIEALLNTAEGALRHCIKTLELSADILRKERAVGVIPKTDPLARKFTREQLEETVLVTQQTVEMSAPGKVLPFCAFN